MTIGCNGYFRGLERLEIFSPLGRLMRHGSPAELMVSDRQRVADAIAAHDTEKFGAYLNLLFAGHRELFNILFEWSLEWPAATRARASAQVERDCTFDAFQRWSQVVGPLRTSAAASGILDALSGLLSYNALKPGVSQQFREKGPEPFTKELLRPVAKLQQAVLNGLGADGAGVMDGYDNYSTLVRTLHDGLVEYCQSYPAAVSGLLGQRVAERMVHDSFSGCSFFEGLWYLGTTLTPGQLAAWLAEHLRFHFAGADREGSVEVIEEADRYRLIFDPCGSGGAMRRRSAAGNNRPEIMKRASAATWHRENEVPFYCSHCAFNELQSIKRLGYPVLVTEFDPDPFKPCGWTVYKNRSLVPRRYYERLGL